MKLPSYEEWKKHYTNSLSAGLIKEFDATHNFELDSRIEESLKQIYNNLKEKEQQS